jgi:hypothetical protein
MKPVHVEGIGLRSGPAVDGNRDFVGGERTGRSGQGRPPAPFSPVRAWISRRDVERRRAEGGDFAKACRRCRWRGARHPTLRSPW